MREAHGVASDGPIRSATPSLNPLEECHIDNNDCGKRLFHGRGPGRSRRAKRRGPAVVHSTANGWVSLPADGFDPGGFHVKWSVG